MCPDVELQDASGCATQALYLIDHPKDQQADYSAECMAQVLLHNDSAMLDIATEVACNPVPAHLNDSSPPANANLVN